MSAEATGFVIRHSPFKGAAYAVHLCIGDSANDQNANEFYMSIVNLARKARCERRTAGRAVDELVAGGWLEVLELPFKVDGKPAGIPGRYRFLFPDGADVVFESRPKRATPRPTPPIEGGFSRPTTCDTTTHQVGSDDPGGGSREPTNPIEPNENPTQPAATVPAASEPELVAAFIDVLDLPGPMTDLERGRLRRAARELVAVSATVPDVARVAERFRDQWPRATVTAMAIVGNWSLLNATVTDLPTVSDGNTPCDTCTSTGWTFTPNDGAVVRCPACNPEPAEEATQR